MSRCSFAKTFWILRCRDVKAQKLIHDTHSMLFSQPQFYLTFPLSCVWNSAMFPVMFYKLFNANSTFFLFFRSSRAEVFCKKSVLRNFAKFTGKHLCKSLFFDKVAGLRLATLLKKRLLHSCFPMNFEKFLRTPFLTEHLRWLRLFFLSVSLLLSIRFTLRYLPPPLLYSEVLFLFLILYLSGLFYTKKEKKKIFLENHQKYGKS